MLINTIRHTRNQLSGRCTISGYLHTTTTANKGIASTIGLNEASILTLFAQTYLAANTIIYSINRLVENYRLNYNIFQLKGDK